MADLREWIVWCRTMDHGLETWDWLGSVGAGDQRAAMRAARREWPTHDLRTSAWPAGRLVVRLVVQIADERTTPLARLFGVTRPMAMFLRGAGQEDDGGRRYVWATAGAGFPVVAGLVARGLVWLSRAQNRYQVTDLGWCVLQSMERERERGGG